MGKKIEEKFKRKKLKHFKVNEIEEKKLKKNAKSHASEADYIRSRVC